MTGFITSLTTEVNATNLWGVVVEAASFIGMGVLFGFGIRMLRRILKKLTKGTGGF